MSAGSRRSPAPRRSAEFLWVPRVRDSSVPRVRGVPRFLGSAEFLGTPGFSVPRVPRSWSSAGFSGGFGSSSSPVCRRPRVLGSSGWRVPRVPDPRFQFLGSRSPVPVPRFQFLGSPGRRFAGSRDVYWVASARLCAGGAVAGSQGLRACAPPLENQARDLVPRQGHLQMSIGAGQVPLPGHNPDIRLRSRGRR
jgi:hypothetical protein